MLQKNLNMTRGKNVSSERQPGFSHAHARMPVGSRLSVAVRCVPRSEALKSGKNGYFYMCISVRTEKNSQNEKSMRVTVLVYLILSEIFLHEFKFTGDWSRLY